MSYLGPCQLCFENPPCRHQLEARAERDAPPPLPEAAPPEELTFAEGTTPVEERNPFAGLRSARAKAPKWATSSKIVRFCIDSGFTPWPRQAEILARVAKSTARILSLCLGRRSGKDAMAIEIVLYEATVMAPEHRKAVQPGERFIVALIGNSLTHATDGLMTTLKRRLEHPRLAALVESMTVDSVTLSTGAIIRAYPARASVIRGAAIAVAVWTEAAHALDSEGRTVSQAEASSIMSALLPATGQFPRGRVILSSTPLWSTGVFAEMLAAAEDPTRPEVEAYRYATPEVSLLLDEDFYRAEAARSWPEYRREYLALLDDGAFSAVFDAEAVKACVIDRGDLPYVAGRTYMMSLDPAWKKDSFALIIGHLEGMRLVIDVVREWRPGRRPLDPALIATEVKGLWAAFGRPQVTTDQASATVLVAYLSQMGITARDFAWTVELKAKAVEKTNDRIWRQTLELPNNKDLRASLAGYERKRNPGGSVKYEAAKGAYADDLADALIGLCLHIDGRGALVMGRYTHTVSEGSFFDGGGLGPTWGVLPNGRRERIG